jgi:phage tail tape measure protein, TP901 family, core region
MAKNTQEARVDVFLNGEAAKKEIDSMKSHLEEMKKELHRLETTPVSLLKPGELQKMKELRSEIKKDEKQLKSLEDKTAAFARTLKNINSSSLKDLQAAAKRLTNEIRELTPGTQEFINKSKQLQQVNTRIVQLRTSFKGLVEEEKAASFSLKGLADSFNKYFGMVTAGIAAITGLSMAFRKSAQDAAALDDTYSDVMKTTGLLHDEVAELDQELMKIDTRTSREQLLLLARDAGKLGIQGKEDILGFVRAADQIQVALGEDLGEGAIKNLGKIADVLGLTQSMGIEKSLLSIASAVNAVGQASTASEGYLVDFTQRLAGVAAQTGISASNIIGFASGLDQSAMKVEMASTAFQKFLMKLYEDPAKFAAYANLEVGKFTELLQNDANQAVITILKALKDQDGFASLVPIFKDMGLDGARAVSVLAAMATNIQAVTDAQALANEEFQKATSVTEEYNTKNNNMQAQLEKARKEFQNASIALGQSLNPIMLKSTKATTYLIKALAQYGKEIKTVLVVIVALTAALKAKVAWQKIVATWNATLRASSLALAAAQALLTGNVTRAAAAWAMMNTAMKASVFGVVTAAIAGLIIWIQRLNKETKQLTEYQKFEKQLTEDVAKATSEEATRVKALKSIVEDSNQAYQERKLALQELKRIVPDYHADLTEEGVLINNNTEALDNYINAMLKAAKTQVLQDRLRENASKQLEQEQYLTENAPADFRDALGNWRRSYTEAGPERGNGTSGIITHWISQDCEAAIDRLEEFKKEEELILDMIRQAGDEGIVTTTTTTGSGGSGNGNGNGSGNSSKTNNAYQEALKDLKQKQREEENSWKELYANNKISKEKYDEEMLKINMKYLERQVKLAGEYGQDETAVMSAWLDAQIAANDRAYAEMMKIKQDWETANQKDFEKWQKEFEALQAQAQEIKDELHPKDKINADFENELANLEKLHDAKLLSEEDYLAKLDSIHKKHNQDLLNDDLGRIKDYIEKANAAINFASQFVTQVKEMETAQLEAEYQKQLTAAGDNAEQKEAIDAEYEQKKLDLQKKYADVEMGINIAKAIGASALAVMQAWTAAGGQPILFAIFAALIAATTAIEIATLVKQRNAIKNASVSGGGGSSSAPKTGQRTVTGYSEGGETPWSASDNTPVGVVHANEYVIPAWMKRREPRLIADLERYRKAGSHGRTGSKSKGFADGGYTGNATPASNTVADSSAAIERAVYNGIRAAIEGEWLRAYLVRNDLTEIDNQDARFKDIFTL